VKSEHQNGRGGEAQVNHNGHDDRFGMCLEDIKLRVGESDMMSSNGV